MDVVIAALVSAAVSILVGGGTLYLNRYWQVRQEVRAEGLKHYRALKTYGLLTLMNDARWFEDATKLAQLREMLLQVGEAIFESDFIASPKVLTRLVRLLRESSELTKNLEERARAHEKVSPDKLDHLKDKLRDTLVELFYAMRADAGRSNRGLKREDVLYLLTVNSSDARQPMQAQLSEPTRQ